MLQWRTIELLKSNGCNWYDLGGINPEINPGSYRFKNRMKGKTGREITFGKFDSCKSYRSLVCVKVGEKFRAVFRKIRGLRAKLSISLLG